MRPNYRLIPDFIVPNLNKSTYGSHLQWEDKQNGSFKISRIHQSSEMWNEQCIEVYKAWSLKKKLWHTDDPKKITKAKHRLITALRRNPEIEILRKENTFYRFRIVHPEIADREPYLDISSQPHVTQKKKDEIENEQHGKSAEELINCDLKSILEANNEQREQFVLFEANANVSYWSIPQCDLQDVQRTYPMPGDNFDDELYPDEIKSSVFSDKCCCEKGLDYYLCNQKCIWHGIPL